MSGIKRYSYSHFSTRFFEDADGLYVMHEDHAAEIARLRAEADALRVDAMRYLWLRDNEELNKGPHPVYFPDGFNEPTQNFIGGSRLDELVDAAMGADA